MAEYSVFGQELYFDESIRAIEMLAESPAPDHLASRVAAMLTHPSEATRARIAGKIVQRVFRPGNASCAFPRLVMAVKCDADRRDLVYWRTARTDALIAAITREIFYPYFVLNGLPRGYDEASFNAANASALLCVDRVISRDFVAEYARRMWRFKSDRTITLALRIMKQARLIDTLNLDVGEQKSLSCFPLPHSTSMEVFAYCLYEEFLGSAPTLSLDRIYGGDCVRLFMLTRLQADSLLRTLERRHLAGLLTVHGVRHIRLTFPSLEALIDALISESEQNTHA